MRKFGNIVYGIFTVIMSTILIWFALSTCEVMLKNTNEHPVYSKYNVLVMLMEHEW